MKQNNHFYLISFLFLVLILSCKTDKKEQLTQLKQDLSKIKSKIEALEKELKIDTNLNNLDLSKFPIVKIDTIENELFRHYIDLFATVLNENDFTVTPKQGGGQVSEIFVKKGDRVNVGQKILQLDNKLLTENIKTTQKNIESIKSQLDFAKTVFEKQQNLYNQKIGSEIQYLTAKNNVVQLENSLQVANQQLVTQQDQLDFFTVKSEVSGTVEELNVKIGSFFTGVSPVGGPQIRIVNQFNLKLRANVPESYSQIVKKGKLIIIENHEANQTLYTKINLVGETIDPITRTFYIEASLPEANLFKPNQLLPIKIQDILLDDVIVLPLNSILKDESDNFVYLAFNDNGKWFARKKVVTCGLIYRDQIVITAGLNKNDLVIVEGMGSLFDGQPVSIY